MEISLALGGGGIKGIAHIGVLECLERAGFRVCAVAGTSAGGMVGAVYAAGYRPQEIRSIVESLDPNRLYHRRATDGPSLLGYTGLAEALVDVLGESDFSQLKIPFACTAVDLRTAQEIYLNEGRLVDAVLATIAVPGVFPPRIRDEAELVDGGILDPVPVNLARLLAPARPVIAVALNPKPDEWHRLPQFNLIPKVPLPIPPPIIEGISRMRIAQALRIFVHSMDITARMLTELRLEVDRPDVIIRPDVHEYGLIDRVDAHRLIQAGYQAAEQAIPEIRKALSWPRTVLRILRNRGRQKSKPPLDQSTSLSLPSNPGAAS